MLSSALMTVLTKAVHKAGRGVKRDFGEIEKLQISKKGVANFVTSADLRTEQVLVDELRHARPKWSFLTEESGHIAGEDSNRRFVIDPIDGTTNFIHAIPYISISVAAQEKGPKGWETIAGIVFDPMHDELFMAEKGKGAFCGNVKLRVSERKEDFLFSTTSPRKSRQGFESTKKSFIDVIESGATVRCSGSAALDLAYVAAGRLDGIWYHRLNIWDMAAGTLLVQEAGGKITAIDGSPIATDDRGSVLAAGYKTHALLGQLLTSAA